MIIDTISIIVAAGIICFAILASLMNPLLRKPRQRQPAEADCPPLSLVITTHSDADSLERTLPLWLAQDYPADLQIIVVTEKGDSQAEDVIKRLAGDRRLYTTFVPLTSRYMSRGKLAVTLGVKAARHEWVMLTRADCAPDTPKSLRQLAVHCADTNTDLVMGYTHLGDDSKAYHRFEQFYRAFYLLRKASTGTACTTQMGSLMFKKGQFMEAGGYQGNLHLIHGEYDFLVNKLARKGNTAVSLDADSQITRQAPSCRSRRTQLVNDYEVGRHLGHAGWLHTCYIFDQSMLHLSYWAIIATAAWGIVSQQWIVYGAAAIALIITLVLRIYIAAKAIKLVKERFAAWRVIPYELRLVWRDLATRIRHMRTDKSDFTTHKQ